MIKAEDQFYHDLELDDLGPWIQGRKGDQVLVNHTQRERYREMAFRAGYKDIPEPMTAVEQVDWALDDMGFDLYDREESMRITGYNKKALAQKLGLHDQLPDGELLRCPICGGETYFLTNGVVRCSVEGHNHVWFTFPRHLYAKQQAINAANAAIRELGK